MTQKEWFDKLVQIAREVFQIWDTSTKADDYLGYLVWNHTAYPFFGANDEGFAMCRRQLEDWRDGKVDEFGMPIEQTITALNDLQ